MLVTAPFNSAKQPVLVLGLGNILLGDDGLGPALVREVGHFYKNVEGVECVDGGTQGMALLGHLDGREALVILDAYPGSHAPGTVSVLEGSAMLDALAAPSTSSHEGNAGELLAAAALLNTLPKSIFLVGIEPEAVRAQSGLSDTVRRALPAALVRACVIIEQTLLTLEFCNVGATRADDRREEAESVISGRAPEFSEP